MTGPQLYALFQVLALLTALLLRRPSPLPAKQRAGLYAGALAGAGLAAKLPFALLDPAPFLSAAAWFSDGKTILAGLAGGYVGVEIAKFAMGVKERTGDGFAVPLAAAIGVGRWGCFFNGCCSAPGLPVPVIESAFHLSMAVVLWRLQRVEALRWQLLKLYLVAYAAFRFVIEFVRTEPRIAGPFTAYHFGSIALIVAMALLWRRDERAKRVATA